MASIYKEASPSLLLDLELVNTDFFSAPAFERKPSHSRGWQWPRFLELLECQLPVNTRPSIGTEAHSQLACSIWMTRSWTLQEGQLPPTIAIRFQNCIVVLGRNTEHDGQYLERIAGISESYDSSLAPIAEIDRSSTECERVDIALQKDIYDTFFADSGEVQLMSRFASVWDDLAGRSTTKAENVPLIMTNMLNLGNRGLLDFDNASQMFQTILLSLNAIPVSIFFNTGPRHDQEGHHQNRWVPIKIGSFGLASCSPRLTIRPTYLEYAHSYETEIQEIRVYTTNTILPLKTKTYTHFQGIPGICAIEPIISINDEFDTLNFTGTCFIIERANRCNDGVFLRGACFYIRNGTELKHSSIRYIWERLSRCPG
jgi:hypothetical protein